MQKYYGIKERFSLEKKEAASLDSIIPTFLKASGLMPDYNNHMILLAWDKVTGASQYTISKYVKDGVLVCSISSSVVRNQLFFQKDAIVDAINKELANSDVLQAAKGIKFLNTLILR